MASTLSSSSTVAQIVASYKDNASYEEDADRDKAAAFITACRFIVREAKRISLSGGMTERETDPALLREEMADARNWLARNPAAGRHRNSFVSFERGFDR